MIETIYQARWEVCGPHFLLGFGDVVGDPVALDFGISRVINSVAGTGITVTGLANSARIDDLPRVSQVYRLVFWEVKKLWFTFNLAAEEGNMRVPDEAVRGLQEG